MGKRSMGPRDPRAEDPRAEEASWNLRLILALSLFGLAMGLATVFLVPSPIEPAFWIAIFVVCAVAIARLAGGRFFRHGLLLGLRNSVWVTGSHVLWSGEYLARQAREAERAAQGPWPGSPRLLRGLGLGDLFEEVRNGSPHPEHKAGWIGEILRAFAVGGDHAAYLGDAPADIRAGCANGIWTLAAAWSPTARPEALLGDQPDVLLRSLQELSVWIERWLAEPGRPGASSARRAGCGSPSAPTGAACRWSARTASRRSTSAGTSTAPRPASPVAPDIR